MRFGTRKPLYEAESSAPPATVCVTGGTGYIAGAIIARLLAAEHSVHSTVRDPGNEKKLAFLRTLPGADARLKFFKVLCACAHPHAMASRHALATATYWHASW